MLLKNLLSFDFELNGKVYDVEELKVAWKNKSIPHGFLTFFAKLFNMKKTNLIPDIERSPSFLDDSCDEDNDKKKLNSAQFRCYNIHYGEQSTPFHIMNARAIYEK